MSIIYLSVWVLIIIMKKIIGLLLIASSTLVLTSCFGNSSKDIGALKSIKRSIARKRIIAAFSSVIVIVLLFIAGSVCANSHYSYIPYESSGITCSNNEIRTAFEDIADNGDFKVTGRKNKTSVNEYRKSIYVRAIEYYKTALSEGHNLAQERLEGAQAKILALDNAK